MLYAMSDLHGYYEILIQKIGQIEKNSILPKEDHQWIFLGDYIDEGPDSCKMLYYLHSLEKELGFSKVVVLRGNHEQWFLDYLREGATDWLIADQGLQTSKSFLTDDQKNLLKSMALTSNVFEISNFIRECIQKNHKALIQWLSNLRLYFETDNQIFVHAGIDEEAGELWKKTTTQDVFLNKYPPSTGYFCKDIIAGHIATADITKDDTNYDIWHDGKSHYYIDGCVTKSKKIPVLTYDEKENTYSSL